MRTLILAAALIAPAAAHADVRDWTPAAFDRVVTEGAYDVTVVPGPRSAVHAQGSREELARIRVRVEDRKLVIGTVREINFGFSYHERIHLVVTTPTPLRAAKISGSGNIAVARVDAPEFKAEIEGSGTIRLAQVAVRALAASIDGSGDIVASGHADKASGDVSGSGNLRFADLRVVDLATDISGSGDVTAFATRTATIGVSGSGNARVRGGARCTIAKSGSGHVDCGA